MYIAHSVRGQSEQIIYLFYPLLIWFGFLEILLPSENHSTLNLILNLILNYIVSFQVAFNFWDLYISCLKSLR